MSRARADLVGKTFGRFTVVGFSHKNKRNQTHWHCKCACGIEKIVRGTHLTAKNHTKSCGCWIKEITIARSRKYDYEFVKKTIESNGHILLTKEFKSCTIKLDILCPSGHLYHQAFSHILGDKWCNKCYVWKHQKKLEEYIKEILSCDICHDYVGFDWLVGRKKHRFEIDIWVPEIKLAIEYDGEQHFKPVCFGGMSKEKAEEGLARVIENDAIKNQKIAEHPEDIKYFIRFNYKEKKKLTKKYVIAKLIANGIQIPSIEPEPPNAQTLQAS